ncbi:hypothetical protein Tco_0218121 [Tanacetum coccineum]
MVVSDEETTKKKNHDEETGDDDSPRKAVLSDDTQEVKSKKVKGNNKDKKERAKGIGSQILAQRNSSELGHGLLSCWLSSHHHHGGGGLHAEKSVAHHTINLLTSTIMVDDDQSDLKFCFKIISPKTTIVCRLPSVYYFREVLGVGENLDGLSVRNQRPRIKNRKGYVLLLDVEVMSSDFIEDFCGTDVFAAHLDLISFLTQYYFTINVTRIQDFSVEQLPWDKENAYTRDAIKLYYEVGCWAVYLRKKLLSISYKGKWLPILNVLVMTRQMQLNLLLTGSHQLMKKKPQVYVSVKSQWFSGGCKKTRNEYCQGCELWFLMEVEMISIAAHPNLLLDFDCILDFLHFDARNMHVV